MGGKICGLAVNKKAMDFDMRDTPRLNRIFNRGVSLHKTADNFIAILVRKKIVEFTVEAELNGDESISFSHLLRKSR